MSGSARPSALAATLACVCALGAALVPAAGATPAERGAGTALTTCKTGNGQGYGYTYLLSLQVKNTSCSVGVALVRHKGKLKGWRCTKKVLDQSPVQYDALMTCSNGSQQVLYKYAQNVG